MQRKSKILHLLLHCRQFVCDLCMKIQDNYCLLLHQHCESDVFGLIIKTGVSTGSPMSLHLSPSLLFCTLILSTSPALLCPQSGLTLFRCPGSRPFSCSISLLDKLVFVSSTLLPLSSVSQFCLQSLCIRFSQFVSLETFSSLSNQMQYLVLCAWKWLNCSDIFKL